MNLSGTAEVGRIKRPPAVLVAYNESVTKVGRDMPDLAIFS